jgi:hypothetical protein
MPSFKVWVARTAGRRPFGDGQHVALAGVGGPSAGHGERPGLLVIEHRPLAVFEPVDRIRRHFVPSRALSAVLPVEFAKATLKTTDEFEGLVFN